MARRIILLSFLMSQAVSAQVAEPPPEAKRYHDLLRKRPQAGTLFDRFHDAWLESASADSLLDFLSARAAAPDATAADHRLLAMLQSRRGQDAATLVSLEAALKLAPGDADTWLQKARIQARMLQFEGALQSLAEASQKATSDLQRVETARLQGQSLLRLNKTAEALKVWNELTAQNPEDLDLAEDVVELMADEGLDTEAATAAQALVGKTKDATTRLTRQLRLGELLLRVEKRDEALTIFETALAQSGQDSWIEGDILLRVDDTFRKEDDLEGLKTRLEALYKTQPQRAQLGALLARVQAESGNQEEAIRLFRELLTRNPGRRDVQESYIALLDGSDKLEEAEAQVQVLIGQRPEDKELLIRLADFQHRLKKNEAARQTLALYLQKAAVNSITPENDHLRVARLHETWEDRESARKIYDGLLAQHPASVSAQEAKAHFLHRISDHQAALKIWKELVAKGGFEDVHRAGQALLAHNMTKEAQNLLSTREADFAGETRFHALVAQLASSHKDYGKALVHARKRLELTGDAAGLDEALKQVLQTARDAAATEQIITELLGKKDSLPIAERCLLSALQDAAGKKEEAMTALDMPGATPAQQLLLGMQKVRLLELRQDWEKAARNLEDLMKLPGGKTSDRTQQRVRLLRRSEQSQAALAAIQEWKTLSPGAVQPWLEESSLLMEQAKQKAALDVLRAASRKFSDNSQIMTSLAEALSQAGQMNEAREVYMTLYEQTQDPTARLRFLPPLAEMSRYTNSLPGLVEIFEQRQRQNRASPLPWLALATIHAVTQNQEEQRRCLQEASRLRPKDLSLLTEIARVEEENGLFEKALQTLQTAAALDKTDDTKRKIAALMLESGDEEAGYRLMFELAGGDKAEPRGLERMADALCERGDWDRALQLLQPLLPKFPNDYRLHYLHAVALEEDGQESAAGRAFLRLLDMHDELPEVLAAPAANQPDIMAGNPLISLPPGAWEWLQLPQLGMTAYAHRQEGYRNYSGGRMYFNGYPRTATTAALPQGWVRQPPNISTVSAMALYHLVTLVQGQGQAEKDALTQQIKSAGVQDAALLLEIPLNEGRSFIPTELLDKHPDHAALHTVWLTHSMGYGDGGTAEEMMPVLKRCFTLFKDSYPALAVQSGMAALLAGTPEGNALADEALTLAERVPDENGALLNVMIGALERQRQLSAGGKPDPQFEKIQERLVTYMQTQWINQPKKAAKRATWLVYALPRHLVSMKRWSALPEVLEEINRQALENQTPQNAYAWGSPGYFSPRQMPPVWKEIGVAPDMLNLLSNLLARANGPWLEQQETGDPADPAAKGELAKVAAQLKTPELRILLSAVTKNTEETKRGLADYVKQPSLKADHWIFAACAAQMLEDPSLVFDFLTKASALNSDPGIRQHLDHAVIHTAMQIQEQSGKLTPEIQSQAGKSLRALYRAIPNTQQLSTFSSIAASLGLNDLVEELKQAALVAQSSPSLKRSSSRSNPFGLSPSGRRREPGTRLKKLLTQKQPDIAFAEFMKDVRPMADGWLSSNWSQAQSQAEELKRNLEEQQALRGLLEQLQKQPATNWKQQQQKAAVLELMGPADAAIEAYSKTVDLRPRAWQSRARLALLLAGKDLEKAVVQLGMIPATESRQLFQRMVEEVGPRSSRRNGLDQRLAAIRLMTEHLTKNVNPRQRMDAYLVSTLSQFPNYIQQGEYEEPRFGGLYESGPNQERLSEKAAEARQRLREAHDQFCLAMTRIPLLAQSGFGPYAGLAMADGVALEKLEPLAREVLERVKFGRSQFQDVAYSFTRWQMQFSGGNRQVTFLAPEDVILKAMLARKEHDKVETELLPLVQKAAGTASARQLKSYATLYICKEEEFEKAAGEWASLNPNEGTSQEIARIWSERKLSAPLHSILIQRYTNPQRGLNTQEVVGYLDILAKSSKPEEATIFLKMLRDVWHGKDEARRKQAVEDFQKMQEDSQRGIYYRNRPGLQGFQQYLSLLSEIVRSDNPRPALRLAREDGLLDAPALFSQICSNVFGDHNKANAAARLMVVAEELKLLAPAEEFRPWFNQRSRNYTCLYELVGGLQNYSSPMKKEFTEALQKRQPKTFGSDLILAFAEDNSEQRKRNFNDFLKARGAELARLSPQAKNELNGFLERAENSSRYLVEEENRPLLKPLDDAWKAKASEMADSILAADSWEAVYRYTQDDDAVPDIISTLTSKDKEKALKLFRHYLKLLQVSPRQLQLQASQERNGPVYDYFGKMGKTPALMNEVLAEAGKNKLSPVWLERYTSYLQSRLHQEDPAFVLSIFTGTSLVADTASFDPLPIPDSGYRNVLEYLLGNFRNSGAAKSREALKSALADRAPTFGTRLILAMLDDRESGLDSFVRETAADFAQLQPQAAGEVLTILTNRTSKYREPAQLPQDLRDPVEELLKKQHALDLDILKKLEDAPTLAAAGFNTDQLQELSLRLARVADREPTLARPLFEKATLLVAIESRQERYHLERWLTSCSGVSSLFMPVLVRAEAEGFLDKDGWLSSAFSHLHSNMKLREAAGIAALLKESPFMEEAEKFRAYALTKDPEGSLFAKLIGHIQKNKMTSVRPVRRGPPDPFGRPGQMSGTRRSTPLTTEVLELIKDQPDTFGHALIRCLLGEKPKTELVTFLTTRAAEMKKLDAETRVAIDALATAQIKPVIVYARTEPALKPLMEKERAEAEEARKDLLAISDVQVLRNLGDYGTLARQLALVSQYNPGGSPEVVKHLTALIERDKDSRSSSQDLSWGSPLIVLFRAMTADAGMWRQLSKEVTDRSGLPGLQQGQYFSCTNSFNDAEEEVVVADLFLRSGLLDGADTFTVLEGVAGASHPNLLHYLASSIRRLKEREALASFLQKQEKPTFGMALMQALLAEDRNEALDVFAASHGADFGKLSPSNQTAVLQVLDADWAALKNEASLPPAIRNAMTGLREARVQEDEKFIETLKKGAKFQALKMTEQRFLDKCSEILRQLTAQGKTDQAESTYETVMAVMEDKLNAGSWNAMRPDLGTTLRLAFFQNHLKVVNQAGFNLAIRLLNHDKTGRLILPPRDGDYRTGNYLAEQWRELGGLASPAHATEKLLSRIHEDLPEEPTAILALPFHNMLRKMTTSDIRTVSTWAAALPKSHKLHALAQEMAAAAQLYLESCPDSMDAAGTCVLAGAQKQEWLWKHYARALEDEGCNIGVRIALGHHLCTVYPWTVSPEVVRSAAKLMIQQNKPGQGLHPSAISAITRCFGHLPVDDEWKKTAGEIYESWSRRLDNSSDAIRRGKRFYATTENAFAMLQLAARTQNASWVDKLFDVHATLLQTNRSSIPLLIHAGYPEKAAERLQRHHLGMTQWQSGIYTWHPDMRRNLPVFIKACKDPGLALLGELNLLQASDPPPPLATALNIKEPLTERIAKLTGKVLTTPFSSEQDRLQAASIIANYAGASAVKQLASLCAQAASKTPAESFPATADVGARCQATYLLAIHMATEASQGRPEAWQNAFDVLTADGDNTSYTSRNELASYATDTVRELWKAGEARDPNLWLPLLEKMMGQNRGMGGNHGQRATSLAYVLATQTPGGLQAWKGKLTEDQRRASEKWFQYSFLVLESAADYVGESGSKNRLPDDRRLRLVMELLADKDVGRIYSIVPLLVRKYGLLSEKEVAEHAAAIYEQTPNKEPILAQLVEMALSRQDPAQAAALCEKALAAKGPVSSRMKTSTQLLQACSLYRAGKKEEAQKVLTALRKAGVANSFSLALESLEQILTPEKKPD